MRSAVLAALLLGCSLPVETKTACRTSADCVDDRICDEQVCVPGGCEPVCPRACDAAEACGLVAEVESCEASCLDDDGLLTAFDDPACKRQWDVLAAGDDACPALQCLSYCRDLCSVAEECRLIVDAVACTLFCQEDATSCAAPAPTACADVPPDVQCYEAGDC